MAIPDDGAPPSGDGEFEPMGRDRRFVVRLAGALLVGATAAAFVGWKAKRMAAGCGSALVRPGGTVIPQGQP